MVVWGSKMDSNEIDVVENGAIVKVFLLEGPFPWNAKEEIVSNAGPFWESYGEMLAYKYNAPFQYYSSSPCIRAAEHQA